MSCAIRFIRASFGDALALLRDEGVRADDVHFDLGMSSLQVDTRERGFSYSYDAPLDMRMDSGQSLTAREVVNEWDQRRIARVLRDFGEERHAGQIAAAIVRRRAVREIDTTQDLVEVISSAIPAPARFGGGHPAKRSFQALRIAVNDELEQIDARAAARLGAPAGGRGAGRGLVPLTRGSPDQALPRRPRDRMHLPAGLPGVRVRPRARGPTAHHPRGRALGG